MHNRDNWMIEVNTGDLIEQARKHMEWWCDLESRTASNSIAELASTQIKGWKLWETFFSLGGEKKFCLTFSDYKFFFYEVGKRRNKDFMELEI